jgi:branched-chain amino acid transport system substrate-binding protein
MPQNSKRAGRLAALVLALALASCADRRPLVLGLAGSFSGRDAALGVSGRNAAELFVRRVNEAGGLGGRILQLATRDFASELSRVVPGDRELLEAGAIAILGHFTSAQALAALDFANEERIALLCPTASAEALSGKRDCVFRTVMSSRNDAPALAADMARHGRKRLLVLEASQNKAYAETYTRPLASLVAVVDDIAFDDLEDVDYARAARARVDAVLIVANSIDAGTIAQELELRGLAKPLYLSGYAATSGEDIVASGGAAVEGAWFVHQIDETRPELAGIEADYLATYGVEADFAALETWDSMCLAKAVIEGGGVDRASFLKVASGLREFRGAADEIALDEYGDATRPLFARTIKDGRIVVLGRVE